MHGMSMNARSSSRGLQHPHQASVPRSSGFRRSAAMRAPRVASSQDSFVKPVDVSSRQGKVQAVIGLAAGVLLSAQAAYAIPPPQLAVQKYAPSAVAELALDSLGEAVRGTNEEATKQVKDKLPPNAPAATEGAARAAAKLKANTLAEPTPGGKTETSPVSMVRSELPGAQRLAMQLAGVSDEAKRATIAEDAKFPVRLDEGYGGAGFKRSDSEEKAYSKDLVEKSKASLPDKLSPGSSDLGAKGPLDPETPSPGVRQ